MKSIHASIVLFAVAATTCVAQESFYKGTHLFTMAPKADKSAQTIDRFGPVGISIELLQPAFVMKVGSVEPKSPADGKLQAGQIIETINGETLKDIDPRIQLGNIITAAEATDGAIRFAIKGGTEVVVNIPVLGAYSPTWPLNCPKSDKIVRNHAEYIKTSGSRGGFFDLLFLLSTGDDSDLACVREWAQKQTGGAPGRFHTWGAGLGQLALCEYYLRTGDKQVLPAIQAGVDNVLKAENNGGWGNRAPLSGLNYGGGGGHLNAGGVHAATFLILAKQCGAEMPDEQFLRVLSHFYRFAGRGNVPYGNNKPEGTYTDNGKNGALALTMAAAAALDPNGEKSVYARARDISAMFGFCSTSFMLHGHTGGGIGEIFRSTSMGLLYDKQPGLYREFMNQRRWHYELSRRFDGSFCILGGDRYDSSGWGMGYALTFTAPRKRLQLFGAPPSPYAKPFKLPERPWGTAADDDFESIQAIAYPDGTRPDFSKDTLANGGGLALLEVRRGALSDEQLARYIRHPNHIARTYCAGNIARKGPDYVLALMSDKDARLRRLALDSVGSVPEELLTPGIFKRLVAMIEDPQEAWFVKEAALGLVAKATPDQIAPHVDAMIPYLAHEEWWLQQSALAALTPVAIEKSCAPKVLPAIGKLLENNHLANVSSAVSYGGLGNQLGEADEATAAVARETLKQAYRRYVPYDHAMPEVKDKVNEGMRSRIATALTKVPGGFDALYEVAKGDQPGLPYATLFFDADPQDFSPSLRKEFTRVLETQIIPGYIGKNRSSLLSGTGGAVYRLVDLYQQLDVPDYNWRNFGPTLPEMSWHYLTFDPPEKKAWDIGGARYRKVTLPAGAETWFKPEFNPAKAGWKTGLQPFGAVNGALVTQEGRCRFDFCRCGLPMKTLWDKEVLLMRGAFRFPELKQGHLYRFLVGGMSHVASGDGYKVYVNGKEFTERPAGVSRREGGKPLGKDIDQSWWSDFSNKEVNIAALGFMGNRKGVKTRKLMFWVQEMKLPPIGEKEILQSATVVPMTYAGWQALQDPDNAELDPEAGRFQWDGKFKENADVLGTWRQVAEVASLDEFQPGKKGRVSKAIPGSLTFSKEGRTDNPLFYYTGDTLLNLNRNEALKMVLKTVDGKKTLFVEAGGFSVKNGQNWKPALCVMQQEDKPK